MPVTEPTQRFSSRVDNYVRYRPGYPPAVLELLKQVLASTTLSSLQGSLAVANPQGLRIRRR